MWASLQVIFPHYINILTFFLICEALMPAFDETEPKYMSFFDLHFRWSVLIRETPRQTPLLRGQVEMDIPRFEVITAQL